MTKLTQSELAPFLRKDQWGISVEAGNSAKITCGYVESNTKHFRFLWMKLKSEFDPNPTEVTFDLRVKLGHDGTLLFVYVTMKDRGEDDGDDDDINT